MKNYDIISVGDAFEDVLILPTDLKVKQDHSYTSGYSVSFELGEKIPLSEVDYEIGGSACNTSVAFSRVGLSASLVTTVGDDTPSEKIFERLNYESVDTSNILIDKKMKTNFSVIFRLAEGRSIFIYRGLTDYGRLTIKKNIKAKWIFLAPVGENSENLENEIISHVSENNSLLAWNPGAIQIKNGVGKYKSLLKNTAVLFLNKEESIKFLNCPVRPSEKDLMSKLHYYGPKIIVITNGKNGAKAFDGQTFYEIPAFDNVIRVDSTGAGDSFASGFIAKLIHEEWDGLTQNPDLIMGALRWGIINSNSVITEIGAQKGLLNLDELKKRCEKYYSLKRSK